METWKPGDQTQSFTVLYPPWFLGVSVCCIRGGRQRADKVPEVVVNFGAIEDYLNEHALPVGQKRMHIMQELELYGYLEGTAAHKRAWD